MSVRKDWIKMLCLFVIVLLGSSLIFSQESPEIIPQIVFKMMPRIVSVQPVSGQIGDELTASGENLDQANVAELRLTDGTSDFKVQITNQTSTVIKFKIPSEVKLGRYSLVTVSKRVPRSIEIEHPVRVTVVLLVLK